MSNSSNQAGGDGSGASGSQGLEIFTSLRYDPQQSAADSSNGPFYMLDYHRDRLQESAENFGFDNAVSRFEGNEGLDWLKETLLREVKSFLRREDLAEDSPCAVKVIFTSTGYMRTEIRPVDKVRREVLYPSSLDVSEVSSDAGSISTKPFTPSPLTGGAVHGPAWSNQAAQAPQPTWLLTLDTKPTRNGPLSTYKTTDRRHYDEARARVLPEATRDYQQYRVHDVIMYDEGREVTETSICSIYFWRDGKWVTPVVAQAGEVERFAGGNRGTTRRWALERGLCTEDIVEIASLSVGELCWISNGVRGFNLGIVGEGGGLPSPSSSSTSTPIARTPNQSLS